MHTDNIAKQIISLKAKDDQLRAKLIRKGELSDGYNSEMEALHNSNAKALQQIMDSIGFPTIDKVGEEASNAAWIIIQHAIGQPEFMKESAALLKQAVDNNQANPTALAYLTDRIAVFEGKPQRYGTQFDWDDNGQLSPNLVDDKEKVNQRREALGLKTLEEQTRIMREQASKENQHPPTDFVERKRAYDAWRKQVGWIE